MSLWLLAVALVAAGLAWLELRRPNRAHLVSRIVAVLASITAITLLLLTRGASGRVTLLTPGAPLAAHSREAVPLERVQSVASLAARQPAVRLAGWGLLPHEWPDEWFDVSGFDRAALPSGITQLDAPTEVGVGERLAVRGTATLAGMGSAWVILEDPAGARDSARVTAGAGGFLLADRPRAPGAVSYRLRLRSTRGPELAETLGVAVRDVPLPSVLILDGSPSFETGYLKRWLEDRGARVTVRTTISRGRYRTERLNDPGGEIGPLTTALLGQYDALLADGATLAALSSAERAVLDAQVREKGLGLLVTADAPFLLARGTCGLTAGFSLEPITGVDPAPGDKGDRRVTRPVLSEAPRQSRTGIETEATSIRPGGLDPIIRDGAGRVVAAKRGWGRGRAAITLLRTPSRWILEGESDQFAAYWHILLRAVARDTVTRISLQADGPSRPDHPVTVDLKVRGSEFEVPGGDAAPPTGNLELRTPFVSVTSPSATSDTIALARDPFDPARWTGTYWPRVPGWHRLQLAGGRMVPFRVTRSTEWIGLEASARLAATVPRVARGAGHRAARDLALAWLSPIAFAALVAALSWLWIEARLGGSRGVEPSADSRQPSAGGRSFGR